MKSRCGVCRRIIDCLDDEQHDDCGHRECPFKEKSMPENWKPIADADVVHVWIDDDGVEHRVSPTFYADSGTPVDGSSGNDMRYSHTEIRCES